MPLDDVSLHGARFKEQSVVVRREAVCFLEGDEPENKMQGSEFARLAA